jgi:SAM-dependent methyltransferase
MIVRPAQRVAVSCLLCFSWIALAQPQTSKEEDAVFRQFLDWLKTQPRDIQNTADPKSSYCAFVGAQGIGEVECGRRWEFVLRRVREGPEAAAIFFDKTYAAPATDFKSTPNEFLVACAKGLKPGRALDIHMGQGRNALYLAEQGWDVTGFDISQEGVAHARAEAERRRIRINAVQQTHQEFDFGRSTWDLVVMSYTWIPLDDAALIRRIVDSIKPGGLLVFEHHLETSSRPRDEGDWLPRPKELLSTFGRLKVLKYEETVAPPDWGGKRSGDIVRMLASKGKE